jgi:ATP-dependent Clp protease ATP-binding subunit ClpA
VLKKWNEPHLGFGESDRTEDDDAMKRFFAPEFRNRLDAIVKFKKLSKDTMKFIVKKFLLELNTMTIEKRVEVNASEEALEYLIDKGFDPKWVLVLWQESLMMRLRNHCQE